MKPPAPGARMLSRKVERLEYVHREEEGDNTVRFHDFGPNVEAWAMPDGSVLLRGAKGQTLWREFRV